MRNRPVGRPPLRTVLVLIRDSLSESLSQPVPQPALLKGVFGKLPITPTLLDLPCKLFGSIVPFVLSIGLGKHHVSFFQLRSISVTLHLSLFTRSLPTGCRHTCRHFA